MATKINKLIMHGFKSFARRTELLFNDDFNCVVGPNGSGKSVSGKSKVLLANGEEIQIKKLVESQLKNAASIKRLDDGVYCESEEPIKIISLNPQSMKSEEYAVSKFIKREGEPHLYEIETRTGKKVRCTGCHPVMIFKNGKVVSSLVRNLNETDVIATPRIIYTSSVSRDKDFARLFGCIIGDGYITTNRVEFINKDDGVIEDFKELILKLFGCKPKYEKTTNGTTRLIYREKNFVNKIISLIKNKHNKYTTEHKYIPANFLRKDLNTISNLLAGLYDTDGTIDKTKDVIEFCSKNEELANQIQRLLLRFGIIAVKKERLCCASNTLNKTKRKYYYLYISGYNNLQRFYDNIKLKCKYKLERLESHLNCSKISNPNMDVLPKETNKIIKKAVNLLGIKYKPLRAEYPRLAAYVEDRCSPTREGLQEIMPILSLKLLKIYSSGLKLKHNQLNIIKVMDQLGLSGVQTSRSLGLSQQVIRDCWAKNKFKAKQQNLDRFFDLIQITITSRMAELKYIMDTLNTLMHSDIYWDEITAIKKVKGEKYVYDLTIPDNHNFIADGIFVHNSNILDAMCFVLGKISAKAMRSERSSHLIYNGGKSKKQAEKAEVSIHFDNSKRDFPYEVDEIKVSRFVNQKGNSVYKINDKSVTRTQVVELLGLAKIDADGHNIILQGDIVRFCEMAGEERRFLIEEIAGISVYEDKKNKALGEMERVEERLKEASIVLKERGDYLKELKNERDEAMKYSDLNNKMKTSKASFLNKQIEKRNKEFNRYDEQLKKQNEIIEKQQNAVNELKEQINQNKTQIDEINKEIETKGETEQVKLHKEVEELRVHIGTSKNKIEASKNEVTKVKQRKEQLQENIKEVKDKIRTIEDEQKAAEKELVSKNKEMDLITKKIEDFRKKNKLDDVSEIEKQMDELDRQAEEKQKNVQDLRVKQQNLLREKDKTEFQLKALDEKMEKISELEKENKVQIEELKENKENFKKAASELNQIINKNSNISAQLATARGKLNTSNEELSKIKSKLAAIREVDGAVNEVLQQKNKIKGIHGTISELGKVSTKYAMALEVAAANKIRSIVVDSDSTAQKAIQYLKDKRIGIANFIPLNKIKARRVDENLKKYAKQDGVLGFAVDLVEFDKKYEDAFNHVFGSTLVVEDLDIAKKIGIGNVKMVTLEGDVAEVSGFMQGGFRVKRKTGFSQIELDSELKKHQQSVDDNGSLITKLEKEREQSENQISKLREKKANLEGDIIKLEKILHLETDDTDASKKVKKEQESLLTKLDKEIEEINQDISEINSAIADSKTEKQELRDKVSQLRNPVLLAELNTFEEKKSQVREELIKLEGVHKNFDTQIKTILSPESEKTFNIIKQHDKEEEEFEAEIVRLKEDVSASTKTLREKEEMEEKFMKQFKGLFTKRTKIDEEIGTITDKIESSGEKIRKQELEMNTSKLESVRISTELEGLKKEYEQYEGIELDTSSSENELKAQISRYEGLLAKMDSVNMKALEIYDTAEAEHSKLVEKKSQLDIERTDVLALINEIETKKIELFSKSFDAVNDHFKATFSQLLTKGSEAFLKLENPQDPFSGGVDIRVKIAGNKFMDIRSLSGGEKTMTALAFIFAIQDFEPASFYILDEVDAALDKTNAERLSNLVNKYSEKAQYIMISHNDNVVGSAGTLYGVSMDEHGISNVVSLKL